MNGVKGFKATNRDMTCRNYQFGIGKFHHEGVVHPCNSGFHFCKDITDVFTYYNPHCRIFEVIGSGTVFDKEDKTVCSDIEFVREIDYSAYVNHGLRVLRCNVAHNKHCLDELVLDEEPQVRRAVVTSGIPKYMDMLLHDVDSNVRSVIARQGHRLDLYMNDRNVYIRELVAKQGYGLDKLINDNSFQVRRAVADQGYGLDILINDIHSDVRKAVADQGYGIDKLLKDDSLFVRQAAIDFNNRKPKTVLSILKNIFVRK